MLWEHSGGSKCIPFKLQLINQEWYWIVYHWDQGKLPEDMNTGTKGRLTKRKLQVSDFFSAARLTKVIRWEAQQCRVPRTQPGHLGAQHEVGGAEVMRRASECYPRCNVKSQGGFRRSIIFHWPQGGRGEAQNFQCDCTLPAGTRRSGSRQH